VTTTRRSDEFHCVADRLDVFGRIVGDFDIELFLEGHDEFDVIQAVGAEVVDEAGLFGDLLRVGVQVLDDDLAHALENVGHLDLQVPRWRDRSRGPGGYRRRPVRQQSLRKSASRLACSIGSA